MVPFWSISTQKIQMLGHARPDDDVVRVSGSPEEGKWLALYSRGGVVTGIVTVQPRAYVVQALLNRPRRSI